MPISRVRRPAAYDITPYTPTQAMTNATTANRPSTVALKRGPATTFDTSASSVRMLYGGDCESSDNTAGRNAAMMAAGSDPLAITVTLLNHCSTSGFCQIGRYASGCGV